MIGSDALQHVYLFDEVDRVESRVGGGIGKRWAVTDKFQEIVRTYAGKPIPTDPHEQLELAMAWGLT